MRLVHFSSHPLDLNTLVSKPQHDVSERKPEGVWVSAEGHGDGWYTWCRDNNFARDTFSCASDITLQPHHTVLHLPDAMALDAFHAQYKALWSPDDPGFGWLINWRKVAIQYQGIIIAPYIWSRRLGKEASQWYYGWDCASGCIWDVTAIASIADATDLPAHRAEHTSGYAPERQTTGEKA